MPPPGQGRAQLRADLLVAFGVRGAGESPHVDARYAEHVLDWARQMYACPTCGYDGPHIVVAVESAGLLVECGDTACAAEFQIPPGGTE